MIHRISLLLCAAALSASAITNYYPHLSAMKKGLTITSTSSSTYDSGATWSVTNYTLELTETTAPADPASLYFTTSDSGDLDYSWNTKKDTVTITGTDVSMPSFGHLATQLRFQATYFVDTQVVAGDTILHMAIPPMLTGEGDTSHSFFSLTYGLLYDISDVGSGVKIINQTKTINGSAYDFTPVADAFKYKNTPIITPSAHSIQKAVSLAGIREHLANGRAVAEIFDLSGRSLAKCSNLSAFNAALARHSSGVTLVRAQIDGSTYAVKLFH